jgi:hypothetical protein
MIRIVTLPTSVHLGDTLSHNHWYKRLILAHLATVVAVAAARLVVVAATVSVLVAAARLVAVDLYISGCMLGSKENLDSMSSSSPFIVVGLILLNDARRKERK